MTMNVAQKLIKSHLVEGEMIAGQEIGLKIDQPLCQDATGTLVMLELEAMGVDRVKAHQVLAGAPRRLHRDAAVRGTHVHGGLRHREHRPAPRRGRRSSAAPARPGGRQAGCTRRPA